MFASVRYCIDSERNSELANFLLEIFPVPATQLQHVRRWVYMLFKALSRLCCNFITARKMLSKFTIILQTLTSQQEADTTQGCFMNSARCWALSEHILHSIKTIIQLVIRKFA